MLTLPPLFFPPPYTYHPLFNKSPSTPAWKSKEPKRGSSLFKSFFVSKKKIRRRSTPIDGFSTLSVPFSNQTFVFSWMRVLCQVQQVFIIYGKLLILTRMLEVLVERLWLWRGSTDRIFLILWLLHRIMSIRCRTSWINLCTSFFLSWQLIFLVKFHIF